MLERMWNHKPHALLVGCKMIPPPWKIVGQFLRKVGIHLSNDLAILLPSTNYTSIEGLVYQGL